MSRGSRETLPRQGSIVLKNPHHMRVLSFVEALLAHISEIYRGTVLRAGSKVYRGISPDNPQMNSSHKRVLNFF